MRSSFAQLSSFCVALMLEQLRIVTATVPTPSKFTASVFPGSHASYCAETMGDHILGNVLKAGWDYSKKEGRDETWKHLRTVQEKVDQCATWCGTENACKSFAIYWHWEKVHDGNEAHCHLCGTSQVSTKWSEWKDFVWYGAPKQVEDGGSGGIEDSQHLELAKFPETFWFGLATAPAHVEEVYPEDPWLKFAREGNVKAWDPSKSAVAGPFPNDRLSFFSAPEVEIDLAAKTGVQVFRMGIDWGRLSSDGTGVTNKTALARYRNITQQVKDAGMKVMMTLFHHSMPIWSAEKGGWANDGVVNDFMNFAKDVATELGDLVDFWVTFNEGHVFVLLSQCVGLWPPGVKTNLVQEVACIINPDGNYKKGERNMAAAHREFYDWAHSSAKVKHKYVGIAHSVAVLDSANFIGEIMNAIEKVAGDTKFGFVDKIKTHLDWLGMNYYGKELLGSTGPVITDTEQFSDSGRAIYPDGLYDLLTEFHQKYKDDGTSKIRSYIVTENGIADGKDILRPAYMTEHLLAVREAMKAGVPVEGFVHWTISDNWEWADGYCPQFGLVQVDRNTKNFSRTKRGSYDYWKKIVTMRKITKQMRDSSWEITREAMLRGEKQPFCRDTEGSNDGRVSLDMPKDRPMVSKDWRFTRLTSAEGDCFKTPWVSQVDGVSAGTTGTCVVEEKGTCPLISRLQRELRCPDHDVTIREIREETCAPQESNCVEPVINRAVGCLVTPRIFVAVIVSALLV